MNKILEIKEIVPSIYEAVVEAPEMAKKARAGEFLVVMVDKGTITIVFMVIGTSTHKMSRMKAGDNFYAFVGPLGHPSEIKKYDTVICVAGGVGTAPIYPIAKAFKEAGVKVITIQGARNKELVFWEESAVHPHFPWCRGRTHNHH